MSVPVTHVVWDWNGTLLDDLDCCVQVTNQMLFEFGLPQLDSVAAYQAVFRFPIVEYYADLGFDTTSGGNFDAAARRYIELYAAASLGCGLHAGAPQTMRSLRDAQIGQVVISASQQDNLLAQLAPFALDDLLDAAHGIADIYAASKKTVAQRWLADSGLDAADVLFVGDSEHDFEIATALGAGCVLFTGGHQGRERLASLGAPLVDSLPDVIAYTTA